MNDSPSPQAPAGPPFAAPTGSGRLVEMHCHECDWHGYGEEGDNCYQCGGDELRVWDRPDDGEEDDELDTEC